MPPARSAPALKSHYHCDRADYVRADERPFFAEFVGKPRAKHRSHKTARHDQHRQKAVCAFVLQGVFTEVQAARICINHSRAAKDTRKNKEQQRFVFEQQPEVVSERRGIVVFRSTESFFGVFETIEEHRHRKHDKHYRRDEVSITQGFLVCVRTFRP